ncbi:hypothetical protein LINGRAHAP2_LOCUS27048, partial [Linum grandiflorum]
SKSREKSNTDVARSRSEAGDLISTAETREKQQLQASPAGLKVRREGRRRRTMAWSATMIGALLGLGTQMYSNALRKLPYMRHPWEHVVGMGLGVVFVNQLVKWDAQLQVDLDKMLEKAKAANERRYVEGDDD